MTENDTDRVWDLMPSERQPTKPPERPDEKPVPGRKGPRTPYPADRPDIGRQPGSEPDYLPGSPSEPPGRM
jgi:hypothetical protein